IGLTGGVYTGSGGGEGYQSSESRKQSAAGRVVGISHRITGVSTQNGQDTWYFDPATGLTSAIVASVRTSDGHAFSEPTILTDDGFVLGSYTYYPGGAGDGEQRAFIYRPDLGLTDLGNLVSGGLAAQGWSALRRPLFADALSTVVGHGSINGQFEGQSVFVMKPDSIPVCLADLGRQGGEPGSDGVLDNNDFIVFINYFFTSNPLADVGSPGGVDASDGSFDNNDFVVFIDQFFAGC
ncbi:MAG TPA: GC-type dockerin domain-anchored protein, partial [Phycisphaerales bacterium]|nr:GC-type dockerin domain-anchored protein [Phycisphaerales bacterium]